MNIRLVIVVSIVLCLTTLPYLYAAEFQCTAVWAARTSSGSGYTISEAIKDARQNCQLKAGSHVCGASPLNVNCVDHKGKCLSRAEFLQHGLIGGDQCNQ